MGPPRRRDDGERVEMLVAAELVGDRADVFRVPDDLAGGVEGVARHREADQLAQPGHGPGARHGQLKALGRGPVGKVRRFAAADREDPDAAPRRAGHRGQQVRGIEQLVEALCLDDAGLAQHPRVDRRLAGQGPRMTLDRAAADGRVAHLEGDDRLSRLVRAPRRPQEALTVADALHEERDHLGLLVVHEGVDHLGHVDVGLVAERDEGADTDAPALGPVEQVHRHAARVADEGHRARGVPVGDVVGGDGHVAVGDTEDPDAVRPDHPGSGRGGCRRELALDPVTVGAELAEPGGADRDRRDPAVRALLDRLGHQPGRHHDDGRVQVVVDGGEARVGSVVPDAVAVRVDEMHTAPVPGPFEVHPDPPGHCGGVRRGADDGDRARVEELLQKPAVEPRRPGVRGSRQYDFGRPRTWVAM